MTDNTKSMFEKLYKDSSGKMTYNFIEDPFEVLVDALGPEYVEYRKNWMKACDHDLITEFPLHLNIALRDKCNFSCNSCVLSVPVKDRKFKPAGGIIPLSEFKKMISEYVKKGLASIDFGAISEPTLVPNLADYVRVAKECGVIDVMFTTNASMLTKKMSEDLIKAGLTWISFSIDAFSKPIFNQLRIGGNYDEVIANILTFLEVKKELNASLPITRVSFLKTKVNIHELPDFEKFWEKRVNVVSLQDLVNSHVGYQSETNFANSLSVKKKVTEEPIPDDLLLCAYPYQRLVVRANGDVLPCCSFHGYEFVLGNTKTDNLGELWNSDKFKQLRKDINSPNFDEKPEICKKCILSRNQS